MYTCIGLFTIPIQEPASQGLVLELLKTTHKERDRLIIYFLVVKYKIIEIIAVR